VHTRYVGRQRPPEADASINLHPHPPAAADAPRVRTLGAFEVWRGETAIPAAAWPHRKAGALFKCLLAAPRQRLHREQAAEMLWPESDPAAGAAYLRECLALYRAYGNAVGIAGALHNLANVLYRQGDLDQALALHEESLALARELDDQWNIAAAIYGLGQVALKQGRYRKAAALFAESLASWHRQGGKEGVIQCLEGLARALARDGHGEPAPAACAGAARLCGAAEAMRVATSMPLPPAAEPAYRAAAPAIRTRLGPAASATCWAEGAAMSLDAAVAHALSTTTLLDDSSP